MAIAGVERGPGRQEGRRGVEEGVQNEKATTHRGAPPQSCQPIYHRDGSANGPPVKEVRFVSGSCVKVTHDLLGGTPLAHVPVLFSLLLSRGGGGPDSRNSTARLSELWYQAQRELDADLSGAELTSFLGRWTTDGKIRDVTLHALTPAGSELTIRAMTDSTNGGLTVHAQLVDWLGEAHKSGPVVSADPTAADVLASIDAVGVGHIGEAASVRAAAASGCNWRSWGGLRIGDTTSDVTLGDAFLPGPKSRGPHYLSVKSGAIVALEGSTGVGGEVLTNGAPA